MTWFFLSRPCRFGMWGGISRRPVILCQTIAVLAAIVVSCIFVITLIDWFVVAMSKWRLSATREVIAEMPVTDFSDSSLSFGIVIDCGSSGSRLFVYCWPPHDGEPGQLLNTRLMLDSNSNPVVMKIEPGLSSYVDKPSEASEHVAQLLKYAVVHIPKEKHHETPVYIMATAGLRLLPERDQEAILDDLRVDLGLQFEFLFSPTHVEVISGKQEGIYSWIAINHALGRFDHSMHPENRYISVELPNGEKHRRKRTVGVMDLGGASLQVAYELPLSQNDDVDKSLLAEFNLGCSSTDMDHHYRLYVTTYLGLGSNEGRSRYENQLLANHISKPKLPQNLSSNSSDAMASGRYSSQGLVTLSDPCLSVDRSEHLVYGNVTAVVYGTGELEACRRRLVPLLNLTSCVSSSRHVTMAPSAGPCVMNGVRRPLIDFHNSEFYGFSEFFYTMEDILNMGGRYDSIRFQRQAQMYCATNWTTVGQWQSSTIYPRADGNRYRLQCFKSAWLLAVLHDGLGFPVRYRQLTSVQHIKNKEVHWSLGALLYKTKYFPLREIEKHRNLEQTPRPPWTTDLRQSFSVFIFATAVLLAAFILYVWLLREKQNMPFHRVPTMSYYMLDESTKNTVQVDRSHYYTPLALS